MCECILRAALSWASFNPPAKVRSKAGGGGMLPRGIGTSRAHGHFKDRDKGTGVWTSKQLGRERLYSWGGEGSTDVSHSIFFFFFFFTPRGIR